MRATGRTSAATPGEPVRAGNRADHAGHCNLRHASRIAADESASNSAVAASANSSARPPDPAKRSLIVSTAKEPGNRLPGGGLPSAVEADLLHGAPLPGAYRPCASNSPPQTVRLPTRYGPPARTERRGPASSPRRQPRADDPAQRQPPRPAPIATSTTTAAHDQPENPDTARPKQHVSDLHPRRTGRTRRWECTARWITSGPWRERTPRERGGPAALAGKRRRRKKASHASHDHHNRSLHGLRGTPDRRFRAAAMCVLSARPVAQL